MEEIVLHPILVLVHQHILVGVVYFQLILVEQQLVMKVPQLLQPFSVFLEETKMK